MSGSSATAQVSAQLARLLGLRVILIMDVAKHGAWLSAGYADLLVDSHDPERAIDILKRVTNGQLGFAIDTCGKETSTYLQRSLRQTEGKTAHLVGLTGLPKAKVPGVKHHVVPIKIHHEIQAVGEELMSWLEKLLKEDSIRPIKVELVEGGLNEVNAALDRMRSGEISGKRLVVKMEG